VSALVELSQIGDKLSNLISCGSIASGGLIKWGSADLSAEPVAASQKNFYFYMYIYV
jgi:hypothetical protein